VSDEGEMRADGPENPDLERVEIEMTVNITVQAVPAGDEVLLECSACGPIGTVHPVDAGQEIGNHLFGHGCDLEQVVVEHHEQEDRE